MTVGGTPAVTAIVSVSAARSIAISTTARMPESLKEGVASASRAAHVVRERFAVPANSHFVSVVFRGGVSVFMPHQGNRTVPAGRFSRNCLKVESAPTPKLVMTN